MTDRYRIDPHLSRFTVHAIATGLLSVFAHSPTFVIRDFAGVLSFEDGAIERMALELTIFADTLTLEDKVIAAERREIEGRMRGEVLETTTYPEITFRATDVAADALAPGRLRLRIGGQLSLHGTSLPHQMGAELLILEDGLRLRGACPLRMSAHGIRPVTALGGAIKLKDDVELSFDIAAFPESEGP